MNIPLNIDWQQILLHLLNFVILAGGLYLLLYRPVKSFMEKRLENYRQQDAAAAEKLAEAEKTAAEVRRRMQEADAAAAEQLAQARKAADTAAAEQLATARAQAEGILADARDAARREHDKMLADSQKELEELAVAAAEKLAGTAEGGAFDQFLDLAERGEHHG